MKKLLLSVYSVLVFISVNVYAGEPIKNYKALSEAYEAMVDIKGILNFSKCSKDINIPDKPYKWVSMNFNSDRVFKSVDNEGRESITFIINDQIPENVSSDGIHKAAHVFQDVALVVMESDVLMSLLRKVIPDLSDLSSEEIESDLIVCDWNAISLEKDTHHH